MVVQSQSLLDDGERQRLRDQYSEIATLAGGLAHEIKNPLSTISMNLELMAEDLADADSPRDHRLLTKIQSVQTECRQLDEILNAFLQFARVGELDLVSADLNDIVRKFIDFYGSNAAEAQLEIRSHLPSNLPPVLLDRSLVRQALLNLAINAQQAMPQGGLLEFQTYHREGRVFLEVIDSGGGMDEKTRAKMFHAFFSTKAAGSGLGLPTVRKIVEAHNGSITCESEPGQGTRFTISLPMATTK